MLKKLGLVLIGFVLGASAFFGVAIAKIGHFGGEWERGKFSEKVEAKISDKLALNAEQKVALTKVISYVEQQRSGMKGNFTETKDLLKGQLAEDKVNRDIVIANMTTRLDTMKQEVPILVNHAADFMDSLTAEQRSEVQALLESRKGMRGWGKHHGRHHDNND